MNEKSYGAKIQFKIKFDSKLEELSVLLSEKLNLPDFWYDTIDTPPHELVGYCEFFGFEVEIKKASAETNMYLFTAITTDSFEEIAYGRIYDLSVWYASHVSFMCKVQTFLL